MIDRKSPNFKNGFTIVELVIVIAVIGILTAIVTVGYGSWRSSTVAAQVKSDLNGAASAMEDYRTFNNQYPSSVPSSFSASEGVVLTVSSSTSSTYCIDAYSSTDNTIMYHINSSASTTVESGLCSGHYLPGVPNPNFANLTWTQRTGVGTCCASVAMTSDGTKMFGVSNTSYFYSSNAGASWTSSTPFANNATSVAASSDGSRIFVSTSNYMASPVYMSTNFGTSWTSPTTAKATIHIVTSSDGAEVAVDNFSVAKVSTNSGSTWANSVSGASGPSSSDSGPFTAISNDGSVLLGADANWSGTNYVWLSTNVGTSWTKLTSLPTSSSGIVAVSGDGQVFYAPAVDSSNPSNYVLYKSTNNGSSWSQVSAFPSTKYITAIKTSTDGSIIVASENSGYVYTSTDGGASWTAQTSIGSRSWTDVAISADGTKLMATASGGTLYTGLFTP